MSSSKYPSRYTHGDKKVTAAQYLAEVVCERQAQKDKKELPKQFWNLPHWKKRFTSQLFAARGLLKLYDEVVVIKAIKSKKDLINNTRFKIDSVDEDKLLTQLENIKTYK